MTRTRQSSDAIHYRVNVSTLPRDGMAIRFEASREECEALARQLGIPAVERLTADLTVSPWRGDGVRLHGTLDADVVQECVVTLDPLAQKVSEPVDVVYIPDNSKLARINPPDTREIHIDPEGEDLPETFSGDRIDIGVTLAESLALGLDPYPRRRDAGFDEIDTDPEPDGGRESPFATLARLKGADSPREN